MILTARERASSLLRHRFRFTQPKHVRAWNALLIAVVFAGCATEFVYNRLDTLASWYFEDLVSLNGDQRDDLRDWLTRTLAWHRQSELQRYADFVDEIAAGASDPGNKATYDGLRARFESYANDLIDKTAPEASRLLLELTPSQTTQLLAGLAQKAETRRARKAKAVASNNWQSEQREDFAKQLQRWTGSSSAEQENIIAAGVKELEPTYLDWAASQQAWRNGLQTALGGDPADASTRQRLLTFLRRPQQHWTAAYAQKVARNRNRYVTTLVALDATLSPTQRSHLRDELRKLSGQLRKLAEN